MGALCSKTWLLSVRIWIHCPVSFYSGSLSLRDCALFFLTIWRATYRCPTRLCGIASRYVEEYNERRLHSAIGYIAPRDNLEGREQQIWEQCDSRLAAARELRRRRREQLRGLQYSSSLKEASYTARTIPPDQPLAAPSLPQ